MSKVLRKMMEEARKGYIDDKSDMINIMRELSKMSVSTLQTFTGKNTGEGIKNLSLGILNDEYSLDQISIDQIELLELISLVEHTKLDATGKDAPANGVRYTDDELVSMQPYRYVGIYYLSQLFQEAQKYDYRFRAFAAFQAKAFFYYLEKVSHTGGKWKAFQARAASVQIELTDFSTVGSILSQAANVQRMCWSPWKPMEAFRRRTLTAYRITAELLIDSFQSVYPKEFELNSIWAKYYRIQNYNKKRMLNN